MLSSEPRWLTAETRSLGLVWYHQCARRATPGPRWLSLRDAIRECQTTHLTIANVFRPSWLPLALTPRTLIRRVVVVVVANWSCRSGIVPGPAAQLAEPERHQEKEAGSEDGSQGAQDMRQAPKRLPEYSGRTTFQELVGCRDPAHRYQTILQCSFFHLFAVCMAFCGECCLTCLTPSWQTWKQLRARANANTAFSLEASDSLTVCSVQHFRCLIARSTATPRTPRQATYADGEGRRIRRRKNYVL
ncbi:hypothetical protein B0T22DRAFT_270574 [Podospora appendiculata]|uniref:Uncharacterized protein n=1 Tax=Podospora appendiculata TaxID=314037 RepID=A0AAE1C9J5_9PEZI|nr:hypothetical protein B0T22DRAFT_270574 [Podospora appendiculata]